MLQYTKAASRALRNSDYIDPDKKLELLSEIMRSWEQFSKVLTAIVPALAADGNAVVDSLAVILFGNFGNTAEIRLMTILINVPYNVMDWLRRALNSEKMSPLLFEKIDEEKNNLTKYELMVFLIHQRPTNWTVKVREYIVNNSKNLFYLSDVFENAINMPLLIRRCLRR